LVKDEALASTLLLEPLVNCGPAGVNFVAYEESTSDTSLSTRMTDAERHWTGPLGGSWPIGGDPPPGAWDHVYRHEEDTISHARSSHAEGAGKINVPPETSGSFAFTEYSGSDHLVQHNESTHTGSFYLSEMPWVSGSFTFENGKHADTEAQTILVSGMTARTETDHSYERWHSGDFYWDGELFFSGATSSLETSAASLTFQLAPPSSTNLHNLHIHGRADLALGSNLYGQGLLRGVVEAAGASGLVPIVGGGVTELGSQEQEVKGDDGKPGDGRGDPTASVGFSAGGPGEPRSAIAIPITEHAWPGAAEPVDPGKYDLNELMRRNPEYWRGYFRNRTNNSNPPTAVPCPGWFQRVCELSKVLSDDVAQFPGRLLDAARQMFVESGHKMFVESGHELLVQNPQIAAQRLQEWLAANPRIGSAMQVLLGAILMKAGADLAASGNPVFGYGLFMFGWNEFYAGMQGLLDGRPHENELTAQAKVGAEMLGLDPRGVDLLKIVIELFGPFVKPKAPAPGAPTPKPRAEVPEKLPGKPVPPPYSADATKPPGPGFEWKGKPPAGSGQGNWYNPVTGESMHPDLNHPPPLGPHWDYRGPDGRWYRIFPNGRIEPK
jgi:hypothetical protein